MPVNKRSRIGRSSSFGETDLLSPPVAWSDRLREMHPPPSSPAASKPPNNPSKILKQSAAEISKQSRPPGILRLSSPLEETIVASVNEAIGNFLENCYYCCKKICENQEVFMYRDLCAFCSAECRDSQIALDNKLEKCKNIGKSQT